MGYPASLPTREVVAVRPQSALVAAPIAPLPPLAHPNGTSGTNPLLGLEPTALAQTPCRKVAAISTTDGEKKEPRVSRIHTKKKNWRHVNIHGLRRGFLRPVARPGVARWARQFRENSRFGGIVQGWT